MKRLLFLLLLASSATSHAAVTAGYSDLLKRDGDTLTLFGKPLQQLLRKDSIQNRINHYPDFAKKTKCWFGSQAVWELTDGKLYLTDVYACPEQDSNRKIDMLAAFGDRYIDGKVFADWANGELLIPVDDMLRYLEMPSFSIYEGEIILTMQDGVLIKEEQFDNSKTYQSKFTKSTRTLAEYLYTHIDWSKIHDLGKRKVKVFLNITPGKNPQDFSVSILKKSDEPVFDQEALHVVESLPEWDVYYKRGKLYPMHWNIPIIFDENKRRQYGK